MIAKFKTARALPLVAALVLAPAAGWGQSDGQSALAQCLELGGAPDNSLPATEATLAALRAAAPFCDAAIAEGSASAEVHFLMGVLQQNDGALALAMDHFRNAAWLAMQDRPAGAETPPDRPVAEAPAPEVLEETNTEAASLVAPAAEPAPEAPGDETAPVVFSESGSAAITQEPAPSALPAQEEVALQAPAQKPAPQDAPEPAESAVEPVQTVVMQQETPAQEPAAASASARCAELAGPPDSGVPVSPAALEASLAALRLARPFCEQAIAEGTASAENHFQLAVLLQNEGKHEAALEHFRKAADMGLAAAHAKLGDYSLFGIGPVKPDVDEAVAAYRLAADKGDLAATTTLAFLYRLGRGVPRDPAQMMRLMTQAADGGYQFAQYRLAQTYLTGDGIAGGADQALGVPNPELGAKYLEMAALQGNSKAILELAQLYADDSGGVPADLEAHARWIEKAAETGDPAAIGALGLLHEKGRGVEQNPQRAAELYVQALETGKVSLADLRRGAAARAPAWDRATAMAFQLILQERGLYEGAIDGVIGPMSARAAAALGR